MQNLINSIRNANSRNTILGPFQRLQVDAQPIAVRRPGRVKRVRKLSNTPTGSDKWGRRRSGRRLGSTSDRKFEIVIVLSAEPVGGNFIGVDGIVDDGPFCGCGSAAEEAGIRSNAGCGTKADGVGE